MSEAQAYVQDGDLGSGEPGSLHWHKCNLRQLSNDDSIVYIKEAFPNMSDEDKLEITVFLIVEAVHDGDGN